MLDFLFDAEALMGIAWFLIIVFAGRLVVTVLRFQAGQSAAKSDMRLSQHILSQLPEDERRRILTQIQELD